MATVHVWFVNSLAKLVAKLAMEREELQAGFLSRPLVFFSTEVKFDQASAKIMKMVQGSDCTDCRWRKFQWFTIVFTLPK